MIISAFIFAAIFKTLLHNLLLQGKMKHIVKILSLLVAISAFWIGLLQAAIIPRSYTWLVSNKQFCPLFGFLLF